MHNFAGDHFTSWSIKSIGHSIGMNRLPCIQNTLDNSANKDFDLEYFLYFDSLS